MERFVIAGLGNPGEQYKNTRHNAGALVVERFADSRGFSDWRTDKKSNALLSEGMIGEREALLALPQQYMNNSGASVKPLVESAGRLVVVYDDVDVPLGSFKISFGRGSGGHKGVQSVIDTLGTNTFARVRIGIAPTSLFGTTKKPRAVETFVLKKFSKRDREKLDVVAREACSAIETIVAEGVEAAMNRFN